MSLSSRPNHSLTSLSNPHYYEVRTEDGTRYRHCGSLRDAIKVIEGHPRWTYVIMYYDIPQTVDVSYTTDTESRLNPQRILPQSDLQELFS